MELPDAEHLTEELARRIEPLLTERSALVGIHSGGAWLARRIHELLGRRLPLGTLDISFYRDDFSRVGLNPQVKPSDIPFEVEGADIILVDDVLYTGRTVRAALNELFDYGRPARILLAVLVDRDGRELPIAAQLAGVSVALESHQHISLSRDETGRLSLSLHEKTP